VLIQLNRATERDSELIRINSCLARIGDMIIKIDWFPLGQSICPFLQKGELSMTASKMVSAPEALPRKKPAANCGPMAQQGAMGAHGHQMHPQEFVRLVGCRDTKKQEDEVPERVH
jgi:hypothetical protein